MEVHDDLAAALAPFQYVVGTTARLGGVRSDYLTPREMAAGSSSFRPQRHRPALRAGELRPHQ